MTITEIFDMFLAGKQLPSLAANQARSLLDLARSKLLARGIRTAEPGTDTKAALLEAHRQLTGTNVYASASAKNPLAALSQAQVAAMLSEHKATGKPLLELFAEQQGGTVKATAKPAATPRPSTMSEPARLAACRARIAAQDRELALLAPRLAKLEAARAKPATRPAPAATRPVAPAPAPAAAPAAGTLAARLTAANTRELAAAILDETEARAAAAKVKTRAQLDKMTAREAGKFFRSGGRLVD